MHKPAIAVSKVTLMIKVGESGLFSFSIGSAAIATFLFLGSVFVERDDEINNDKPKNSNVPINMFLL